ARHPTKFLPHGPPPKLNFPYPKENLRKKNREQGFDKVQGLWKGRGGVWGREGKLFFRKVFPPFPNASIP
ncbi:hypothetical protein, partial [Bilophila wadsworthia]